MAKTLPESTPKKEVTAYSGWDQVTCPVTTEPIRPTSHAACQLSMAHSTHRRRDRIRPF